MKRLLLSCALIGATFACNAMDPEANQNLDAQLYQLIQKRERTHTLTAELVQNLAGNEYVIANLGEFFQFVLLRVQHNLKAYKIDDFINHQSQNPLWYKRQLVYRMAKDLLGRIRIYQIALEICKEVAGYDKLDIEGLEDQKAQLEELLAAAEKKMNTGFLSSVPSAIFSRNGAIGLAVLVAGYFGISYWKSSKETQQDN